MSAGQLAKRAWVWLSAAAAATTAHERRLYEAGGRAIAAVSLPLLLRTGGRKGHGGTGLGKKGSGCGGGHPRQRLALDLPSSRLPSHCFLNRFAIETYTYRQAGRQADYPTHTRRKHEHTNVQGETADTGAFTYAILQSFTRCVVAASSTNVHNHKLAGKKAALRSSFLEGQKVSLTSYCLYWSMCFQWRNYTIVEPMQSTVEVTNHRRANASSEVYNRFSKFPLRHCRRTIEYRTQ